MRLHALKDATTKALTELVDESLDNAESLIDMVGFTPAHRRGTHRSIRKNFRSTAREVRFCLRQLRRRAKGFSPALRAQEERFSRLVEEFNEAVTPPPEPACLALDF